MGGAGRGPAPGGQVGGGQEALGAPFHSGLGSRARGSLGTEPATLRCWPSTKKHFVRRHGELAVLLPGCSTGRHEHGGPGRPSPGPLNLSAGLRVKPPEVRPPVVSAGPRRCVMDGERCVCGRLGQPRSEPAETHRNRGAAVPLHPGGRWLHSRL